VTPDARKLLDSGGSLPLDEQSRNRIVAEWEPIRFALLELPRGLSPAQLAGGFGLADALPVPGRIEQSYRGRMRSCRSRPGCCWCLRRPSWSGTRYCCGARLVSLG